jgi:hypothetical protein
MVTVTLWSHFRFITPHERYGALPPEQEAAPLPEAFCIF